MSITSLDSKFKGDNRLKSFFFQGDIAAFTKRENTCNRLLYGMAFYTLVVMTIVIGVMFLLDFTVFVYKRCHPSVKEEEEEDEDEDETDEREMKHIPQSDKTAIV